MSSRPRTRSAQLEGRPDVPCADAIWPRLRFGYRLVAILLATQLIAEATAQNIPGYHSADTDGDLRISPAEFQRARALYEFTADNVRTGEYSLNSSTIDGFQPGPGAQSGGSHSADYDHDWRISAVELARLAELMNWPTATNRTGHYHFETGRIDGFAVGPMTVPPEAGRNFAVPGIDLLMIAVPAGWWAGKFEVTQQEYEAIMGSNPSLFKGPRRPVEMVSWHEAVAFCVTLTERERDAGRLPKGFAYRLPTAPEWESAGRAGTTTQYYWGDDWRPFAQHGWFDDNALYETHDVGLKKPNDWGLHDVMGNVWEWTLTWWDPLKSARVFRGGGWTNGPRTSVFSELGYAGPEDRLDHVGLRVILAPVEAN